MQPMESFRRSRYSDRVSSMGVLHLGMILVEGISEVTDIAQRFESPVTTNMSEMNQIPFFLEIKYPKYSIFSIRIKHEDGGVLEDAHIEEVLSKLKSHFGLRFIEHGWS